MKKIIGIIIGLLLSILIVIGIPMLFNSQIFSTDSSKLTSILAQKSTLTDEERQCTKIYDEGKLIGVVTDINYIYNLMDSYGKEYESTFENVKLGFNENVVIDTELNYNTFENIDDKIFYYLINNDLIGIKTTEVELSDNGNVFDAIYVKDINDFYNARDEFLLNFIDEKTLAYFKNHTVADELTDYGTIDYSIAIQEEITYKDSFVSIDKIFTTQEEIYEYLCYGRNTERTYYTTVEGDTLQGVGSYYGDLSPEQIYSINKDVLSSPDQVIVAGMTLNVTYFESPLTFTVTKHNLVEEQVKPDNPKYEYTTELAAGTREVISEEQYGSRNVLYEETWVNGVLQSGKEISSITTLEPVQGLVRVGQDVSIPYQYLQGTGNFIIPVDNPHITCNFGCYAGHTGTDFQNKYWSNYNIYAIDDGTVTDISYDSMGGYYVTIDHNNGWVSKYEHMRYRSDFVIVGQSVSRGDIIGIMGATGYATGTHLHLALSFNGTRVNACNILDCSQAS